VTKSAKIAKFFSENVTKKQSFGTKGDAYDKAANKWLVMSKKQKSL
jgi:hypothetical protein